jgi:NAD(P)-dependent dehydrogenase (short-subunit alcohol dehydrogenase family)
VRGHQFTFSLTMHFFLFLYSGVNHIAHHFLTRALLPYVTPWGRVVTVTAQAHNKVQNFALDDLNYNARRYSSYAAYCQSKLSNILFSKALQDKLNAASSSNNNIISLSIHPGLVLTNMWRQCGDLVVGSISDFISCKTPEQGASTNVFCCLAKEGFVTPGEYFVDCKSSIASSIASDKIHRNKLWEVTELMIREAGFWIFSS